MGYPRITLVSVFRMCSEKPHSATHWADNYATVGRIRTMSTQVTEGRYKSAVKTKARKTNNQASFGGSLLQNNMEVEAAIEMARHLDETGSHRVRTGFAKFCRFHWFVINKPDTLGSTQVSIKFLPGSGQFAEFA